jgi:muramoyltetrapeptide carboxypeptidase
MPATKNLRSKGAVLVPKPLKFGDLVGVVATSGPIAAEALAAGIRFLEFVGFHVKTGCHVHERTGYLAGTDDQRCDDLNSMLTDSEVRGIFVARGGYGAMRLLDGVNIRSVMDDPKIIVGMSDVTALLLSLYSRCRLVTFAGPMIAGQVSAGLDSRSEESFIASLISPLEHRELWSDPSAAHVIRPGRATGVLLGGCLSLITALVGTSHMPDLSGAILLLEDVGEPAYRIDRMLTQLKLTSVLDQVSAVIVGHFVGPDGEDLQSEVEALLSSFTATRALPIVSGFPHGHILPNITVPHGVPVELNSDPVSLRVQSTVSI